MQSQRDTESEIYRVRGIHSQRYTKSEGYRVNTESEGYRVREIQSQTDTTEGHLEGYRARGILHKGKIS